MSIVPSLKGVRVLAVLLRSGFKLLRQKGSHAQLAHPARPGRIITIPITSKTLRKETLLSILKQAELPLRDFLDLR